jgi:DNA-binding MarR family transcriptional regulator
MKQPNKSLRGREEAGPDFLWLRNYLPYRMGVVATRMLRDAGRIYKQQADPLTTPEFRVIGILANFEPLVASEISKISMLNKVAVSRALAQLTRRKFVRRSRTRKDRRILEVTLTAEGWRRYGTLVPLMRRQENNLRNVIDAADLQKLFDILDQYDAFFAELSTQRAHLGEIAFFKVDPPGRTRSRTAK